MFKHIVVPVDLGPGHEQAVDLAVSLLKPEGGHMTLVHAVDEIEGVPLHQATDIYERIEHAAREHLGGYLKQACTTHITGLRILRGDRTSEILRLVEECNADLIVLRSHRIDPCDPAAGWAALSHKIAALAPCPVLLVKAPKRQLSFST